MNAPRYLEACQPVVESALDAALPPASRSPERLHAAMRHLVFPGGKRLRPALALAAAEAVGGKREAALPAAVAVELVHVYSLIHDDLPCMDDDVERRGRPTVHVAFDEATAVLAGDALLTRAFGVLVEGAGDDDFARRLDAVRTLSDAAGAAGLVGGQVDDLAGDAKDTVSVESVHARKSAALIAASITCGARLAGADGTRLATLHEAGLAAGVAFQIADDLLDAEDEEDCSLVPVLGVDGARARATELLANALDPLDPMGEPAEPLRGLLRYAVEREI